MDDITPGTTLTLLHVDSDAQFRDLTATFIERIADDVVVRTAADAASAMDELATVDAVITDYRLSDTDGISFLDRIRTRHPELPVVFYTNCDDPLVEARTFEHGAVACFRKRPTRGQYEQILGRIRNALARGRGCGTHRGPRSPASPLDGDGSGSAPLLTEE